METRVEKLGDVAVVSLLGDHLDASIAEEFKRDLAPIIDANPKVVFDMSSLQFVDSAGLGSILSCLRKLGAVGGDLKLSGMTDAVRSVFEIARMHRIFDIFATKEEAIRAFQA